MSGTTGARARIRIFAVALVTALLATALIGGLAGASQDRAAVAKSAERGKSLKKQVKDKVKNGRYVGTRGDGQSLDYTFCGNGKFYSNTGGGISTGKSWKITNPHRTKRGFFARLKGSGGYQIAIAKANGHWKIGYWFTGPEQLGKVERSKVSSKTCRKL